MQTINGTSKASVTARCSFDIPIRPALAPTIKITQEGAPDVSPNSVVFKYLSCPARSKEDTNEGATGKTRHVDRYH